MDDKAANVTAAMGGGAETAPATPRRARRTASPMRRWAADLRAWWDDVCDEVDHGVVLRRISEESGLTPRYVFMTCMSAGIAILGLLLSSPAVVIGAMLLSPLMGPILGAGFALAEGKFLWLRLCAKALFIGTLVAIAFCALIVWLSPLQTVTSEIAARTRPNLFDLLVALFSSLAGSYAMIRGREGTIVGVAIATALMPPLAVVGFGLATWNMPVFGGALMLFVTNFLTIALTATVMARLYGFRSSNTAKHGLAQNLGILVIFLLLAIPLGLSLRQIAWEANGQRIIGRIIEARFDTRARIDQLRIDWDAEPVAVTASVLTPQFLPNANARVAAALKSELGEDITVTLNQYRVGTEAGAADQAALTQARAREQDEAFKAVTGALIARMAVAAGIEPAEVVVDAPNRRVIATARPLPGLTLAGYRTLEARVGQGADGWTVRLRPPLLPLPSVTFEDGEPDAAGREALATIRWAATRTGVPVALSGPGAVLDPVMETIAGDGEFRARPANGGPAVVNAAWEVSADVGER